MREMSAGPAIEDGRDDALDSIRRRFHDSASLQEGVVHLSRWFGILRAPPYSGFNEDERLLAAVASVDDHPVRWCSARSLRLPLDVETSLAAAAPDGSTLDTLDPLVRYVLGRAAMRCMADAPGGSSGLSLAYGLLWPLLRGAEADAGADDELAVAATLGSEARGEIEAQARRFAADPAMAARSFDRQRTTQALLAAARPASLEACAHWNVRELALDFPFGQVVRPLAAADAGFTAGVLATLGNPALVAAALGSSAAGLEPLRSRAVLRSLPSVFDAGGRWTEEATAWMVVLHLEDGLSGILDDQLRAVRSGAAPPQDPVAVVSAGMSDTVDAVLARPDGPRLTLEWLARLVWSAILGPRPFGQGVDERFDALQPRAVLLNALAARLEREEWANPVRVWTLFSGGPAVSVLERGEVPKGDFAGQLPTWRDWLGQPNPLVPLAVAVQLLPGSVSVPAMLPAWIKLLFRNLRGASCDHQMAEAGPNQAASYLAWPLASASGAAETFADLWSDSGWLRTSARFAGLEEAPEAVRPCFALLRVGLRMLQFQAATEGENGAGLATALADAVDEVRYTLPEIGITEWPSLAGSLAGIMATRGLLAGDAVGGLLARYQGDDAALAAAAVNMAANGVPATEVRRALESLGERADRLARRWEAWNDRFARDDRGKPSDFLARLTEIAVA